MISIGYIQFIGIVLLLLGIGLSFFDKLKKTHYLVDGFLYLSWICAVGFTLYVYKIFDPSNPVLAAGFAPFGVIIAAFIASASVMKNIAETKAHDISKSEKEKERKRAFSYKVMETIYHTIRIFSKEKFAHGTNYTGIEKDIDANVDVVKKLMDTVFSDKVLPYIPEEEQYEISNIYKEFYYFIALYVHSSNPMNLNGNTSKDYDNVIREYNKINIIVKKYIDSHKNLYSTKDPQ